MRRKGNAPAARTAGASGPQITHTNERTRTMNSKHQEQFALVFLDTKFEVVDQDNQPWLRGFQIGSALGFKNPSADIAKLYDRNADEFTEHMTRVIDLQTAGGMQKVRIFSLRGAHLLGVLAKTERAKLFRVWMLDVLDGVEPPQEANPMTHRERLAYSKERRVLVKDISKCTEIGAAHELYVNLQMVSRPLGRMPIALELLAPAIKQQRLGFEGGAA